MMETWKWTVFVLVTSLKVAFIHTVTVSPPFNPYFVKAHNALELRCHYPSAPAFWQKDTKNITDGVDGFHVSAGQSESILRKELVDITDSGEYKCLDAGGNTAPIEVSIVPVRVSSAIYNSSNENLTIRCEPQFLKIPSQSFSIKWVQPNGVAIADSTKFQLNDSAYSLTINSPKAKDGGQYHCYLQISNDDSQPSLNESAYIYAGPALRIQEKSVVLTEGQRLDLHCEIISFPMANLTWRLNDKEITNSRVNFSSYNGYPNGTLTIVSVVREDRGDYMCCAVNEETGGRASRSVTVRVKDHLAWLWPLIGILVQVFVLLLIIWVPSIKCRKTRPLAEDTAVADTDHKPTSSRIPSGDLRKRSTHL